MLTIHEGLEMLEAEQRASYRHRQRLNRKPLQTLIEEGEILGPVRGIDSDGSRAEWIEAKGFYCKFRKGDWIALYRSLGRGKVEPHATGFEVKKVRYPARGVIRLAVTRKKKAEERPQPCDEYFVYPDDGSFADRMLQRVMEEDAGDGQGRSQELQLGSLSNAAEVLEGLNESQRDAFQRLCQQAVGGAVQGPPGTGKTKMLQALVRSALASGLRVGLTAYTHAAVDNALSGITSHLALEQAVRVGSKLKIKEELYDSTWLQQHRVKSLRELRFEPQLIAATCHSWALNQSAPHLDLLVVDEAGQIPAYMATILTRKARRVICLGDHKQLAPVLLADHRQREATDMFSAFRDGDTPMLDIQYRMNRDIQSWSADRYYEGRLQPHESNAERDVLRGVAPDVLGTSAVQLASHTCLGERKANSGEAEMVAERVEQIMNHGGMAPDQIGVIAPHRMHNGAILQALQDRLGVELGSSVQVDTVERFQGQETEAILYSVGVSSASEMNKDSGEFLADPRRINVAVTRARSRFVCLASKVLRRALDAGKPGSAERELADFLGWCEAGTNSRG